MSVLAMPGRAKVDSASFPAGDGAYRWRGICWVVNLFFRRWARPLYVASLMAGLVLIAVDPGALTTGVQEALASLNMLVSGFVIALMYFSPARREFEYLAPAA